MQGLREDGPERVLVEPRLGFVPAAGVAMVYPVRVLEDSQELLRGFRYMGGSVAEGIGRRYGSGEYRIQVRDHGNGPDGTRYGPRKVASPIAVVEGFGPPRNGGAEPCEEIPEPEARPPSPPPREASRMRPTMVQEAAPSGDPLVLQVLAELREIREHRRDEGTVLLERLVSAVQALTETVTTLLQRTDAIAGRMDGVEAIAKKAGEGTQLRTFEEWRQFGESMNAMGLQVAGARARDEDEDDERPRRNPEEPATGVTDFLRELAPLAPLAAPLMDLLKGWIAAKMQEARQPPPPSPPQSAPPAASSPPVAPAAGSGASASSSADWVAQRKAARQAQRPARVRRPVTWGDAGSPAENAGTPG